MSKRLCNADDDDDLNIRSWWADESSLYISDSDTLRVWWSAAISIYYDSIVLLVLLEGWVLWDK